MIYFDNAATTPILPEVIQVMSASMQATFGNPSSTHVLGRTAKSTVENARKNIAKHFHVSASEIVFTAGGSEADNLVLYNAVTQLGVQTIISSPIEHHAILHTLEYLHKTYGTAIHFVKILNNGQVDLTHLNQLLSEDSSQKMVSLMYVNNEIGTILDLKKVSNLCQQYQTYFHSDTVQGIGHFDIDLQQIPIDFIAASAHKFHGPKGVGFAFIRKGITFQPLLHGGDQEHGLRAGTENVHSILGMEMALNIALADLENDQKHISSLKNYFVNALQSAIPQIAFNAESQNSVYNSYHILNVRFPEPIPMFLFKLDLKGIAASGGSACQSGSQKGSHVLKEILDETNSKNTSVRFSFSKFNNQAEVDEVIKNLLQILVK